MRGFYFDKINPENVLYKSLGDYTEAFINPLHLFPFIILCIILISIVVFLVFGCSGLVIVR